MINIAIKLATSITYTADGSQTNFSVPFDYLRPSFVHVSVNDAEVSEGFTISNRMVMFDSAPAKDAVVHIYRSTPTTRLVSWADASILKAIDMTIAEVQQLHILEEANDWSKTHSIVFDEERGVWQGRNYRVSNVSDPTEAQDVVTKNYLENTEDSFVQRMNAIKTQTEQFANTAGNSKDSAYKSAQTASTSAASAAESARLAEGYKNVAETAKSDASLYAANAKTYADNAGASKEAAQSAATTASNFATASRSSANEARTYRDNAKTYRDNAELYMNNTKNYSENVNVFIPSVSSAGVLSWTNKAGLPNPASVNIKGAKGDKGDTGAQGIQGVKGEKGDTGEQGARGAAGKAGTIHIGTVTTGEPGSEASVTNSGTVSDAVFDFTIPRGEKGEKGEGGGGTSVTVDTELSATSTNPVQNKVIKNEFDKLLLPDGMLTTPSSRRSYISKVASDSLSLINNLTQTVIEQSADGNTWETLFDSDTANETVKTLYKNGLDLSPYIDVGKGKMVRVTLSTHTTLYFASIALGMKILDESNPSASNSYKCYAGMDSLSANPVITGTIATWGSTPCTVFRALDNNIVRYVFNEDKKDLIIYFSGIYCKGSRPNRTLLRYDSGNKCTVTDFPIEAPSFLGTATKATQDGDGKVIADTYAKRGTSNNLIDHSNEFNFVPKEAAAYNGNAGIIYLNYRFSDNSFGTTDSAYIKQYHFLKSMGKDNLAEVVAAAFVGLATKAKADAEGNIITDTYAKISAANMWEEQQDFKEVKLGYEKYLSRKISNTGSKPQVSLMQYEATGAFTLDLSSLSTKLQINESTVFTAYIASSADYPLTITNAGTIKYIGSASDVAITSAGLLLNILIMKDASDTVTSIVQASKLS